MVQLHFPWGSEVAWNTICHGQCAHWRAVTLRIVRIRAHWGLYDVLWPCASGHKLLDPKATFCMPKHMQTNIVSVGKERSTFWLEHTFLSYLLHVGLWNFLYCLEITPIWCLNLFLSYICTVACVMAHAIFTAQTTAQTRIAAHHRYNDLLQLGQVFTLGGGVFIPMMDRTFEKSRHIASLRRCTCINPHCLYVHSPL